MGHCKALRAALTVLLARLRQTAFAAASPSARAMSSPHGLTPVPPLVRILLDHLFQEAEPDCLSPEDQLGTSCFCSHCALMLAPVTALVLYFFTYLCHSTDYKLLKGRHCVTLIVIDPPSSCPTHDRPSPGKFCVNLRI